MPASISTSRSSPLAVPALPRRRYGLHSTRLEKSRTRFTTVPGRNGDRGRTCRWRKDRKQARRDLRPLCYAGGCCGTSRGGPYSSHKKKVSGEENDAATIIGHCCLAFCGL